MKPSEFINLIAPMAVSEATRRKEAKIGWSLPSICIAQAALETGWGASQIMTKAHAYFGIKWTAGCGFKAYSCTTKEVYNGEEVILQDALFRAYDSLEESIWDYFNLICGSSYYKKAVNNPYVKDTLNAIARYYATSPDYYSECYSIINQYKLWKYDADFDEEAARQSIVVTVDGLWGKETTAALQKIFNCVNKDGIIHRQMQKYKKVNPGLCSGVEWTGTTNDIGDETIKGLQRWLGVDYDGHIGPQTIRALQHKLGTIEDGCLSIPSQCVRALQDAINGGLFNGT